MLSIYFSIHPPIYTSHAAILMIEWLSSHVFVLHTFPDPVCQLIFLPHCLSRCLRDSLSVALYLSVHPFFAWYSVHFLLHVVFVMRFRNPRKLVKKFSSWIFYFHETLHFVLTLYVLLIKRLSYGVAEPCTLFCMYSITHACMLAQLSHNSLNVDTYHWNKHHIRH